MPAWAEGKTGTEEEGDGCGRGCSHGGDGSSSHGGCWECLDARGLGKGMRRGSEGPAEVRGCDLHITWAPGCMMLTVSADWMQE